MDYLEQYLAVIEEAHDLQKRVKSHLSAALMYVNSYPIPDELNSLEEVTDASEACSEWSAPVVANFAHAYFAASMIDGMVENAEELGFIPPIAYVMATLDKISQDPVVREYLLVGTFNAVGIIIAERTNVEIVD